MLCQQCNEKPATVHFTKIVNNKKTQLYLCEKCASKHHSFVNITPFSINDLLAGFMDFSFNNQEPSFVKKCVTKCETCGMDYSQFKRTGLVGCRDCYRYFRNELRPVIEKIQGRTEHTGKIPRQSGLSVTLTKQIDILKSKLKKAVEKEAYEEAAVFRDQIKQIEEQLKSRGEL